jgi:Domain of unknown function (DUF222)
LAGKIASAANPDIYQVIVHVGPEALTADPAHPLRCHVDDGPAIGLSTAQMIACNAAVSWMLHDHKGDVLDVGRRHRRPSPALRRAVRERDRSRCDGNRFSFTRADGTPLPASPPLPEADGDLATLIDTDISTRSIIPLGLADRFDLDLSIWACFANARVARLAQQQPCG